MIRALVITGFGINCEEEMAAAYELAGAKPTICHINQILQGYISIHDYRIINFPGGFSFGDDLGAGKAIANRIRFKKMNQNRTLLSELEQYLQGDNYILGICNGFQALVKMGLLPNTSGNFEQEVSLTFNDSGKFEDRWVYCSVNKHSNSPYLQQIEKLSLPCRHKEGKLVIKDDEMRDLIKKNHLHALTYCDENGDIATTYPALPNGSALSCAGLSDMTGKVLGMMPHPEAFLSIYNHPHWPSMKRKEKFTDESGEGLLLFKNIVKHLS